MATLKEQNKVVLKPGIINLLSIMATYDLISWPCLLDLSLKQTIPSFWGKSNWQTRFIAFFTLLKVDISDGLGTGREYWMFETQSLQNLISRILNLIRMFNLQTFDILIRVSYSGECPSDILHHYTLHFHESDIWYHIQIIIVNLSFFPLQLHALEAIYCRTGN